MLHISRLELPCGKDIILLAKGIDVRGYQRWPGEEFEEFDMRILEYTMLPGVATVQTKEV